jgi:hypothetical protein
MYNSLVENTAMRSSYMMHRSDTMDRAGTEMDIPRSFLRQMLLQSYHIMDVKKDCMQCAYICWASNDGEYVIKVIFNGVSMMLVLFSLQSKGSLVTSFQRACIGRHDRFIEVLSGRWPILEMSIKQVPMIFGFVSW